MMRPSTLMATASALVLFPFLDWIGAQPHTGAPRPGPEQQKLAMLVGEWTFEGQSTASVLAPQGQFSGQSSARFVSNGFFVEIRLTVTGPSGVLEGTEMRGYDAATQRYTSYWFMSDGSRIDGTETFTADGFSADMVRTDSTGKQVLLKARWHFAADRTAFTARWEVSPDAGQTWVPFQEYSARRTDK
jgi:hypothetical protein